MRKLSDSLSARAMSPDLWEFDARRKALVAAAAFVAFLILASALTGSASEPALTIVGAGVEAAEDSPFVPHDFKFLPGDFVYFIFEIGGFAANSDRETDIRKIALTYEIVPQDSHGIPLTPPARGDIKEELHPEDKHWMPKRRASFLLPSFLSAGEYRIHVTVQDAISKTESSADYPFLVGGVEIKPTASITVQNFRFLRKEDDQQPLEVPAYSPGDNVFVRFDMSGYKLGPDNQYRLMYGLTVLAPDGKPFIQQPHAAALESNSFYPAQFVPGNLNLTTPKDSPTGEYVLILTVRDLVGNQIYETKHAFSIER